MERQETSETGGVLTDPFIPPTMPKPCLLFATLDLSGFLIVDFSVIADVMEDQGLEIVQRKQTIRNQDN